MVKYVCNMNRLDFEGNDGGTLRRGDIFEIKTKKRAKQLLEAGYISEYVEPIEEPEIFEDSKDDNPERGDVLTSTKDKTISDDVEKTPSE